MVLSRRSRKGKKLGLGLGLGLGFHEPKFSADMLDTAGNGESRGEEDEG